MFSPVGVPSINKQQHNRKSHGFWNNVLNRKQFLLDFAREKGFDPKVTRNWLIHKMELNTHAVGIPFLRLKVLRFLFLKSRQDSLVNTAAL